MSFHDVAGVTGPESEGGGPGPAAPVRRSWHRAGGSGPAALAPSPAALVRLPLAPSPAVPVRRSWHRAGGPLHRAWRPGAVHRQLLASVA
jgi:hypothetical protein